jgi:acyl carrier protein
MNVAADVESVVMTLIAEVMQRTRVKTRVPISREHHLQRDLGFDSIALISMLFAFEQRFGVNIDSAGVDIDVARLMTVEDVIRACVLMIDGSSGGNARSTELA